MATILRAAVQFRLLVLAVAAGVLALGLVALRDAPVDVLPEFTPPYAEIQTEALGLSAEEVEQLITVPLEADLLNGVEGVEVIRSESLPGLSSIVMVFAPGTDTYVARQLVEERLTQAHALPNVSRPPQLLQPLSSSNRVLLVGLDSDKLTPIEQSVIARWTVKPRLMGVPGVANVAIWGMREQQLQVQVDPKRLAAQNVTLGQVISSAGNAQVVSPLTFLEASTPGTGGFVETPQQRLQVRHLLERLADPEELGKVPVEGTGGRLQLSDVADIRVDHQPLIGDAVVHGGNGLMLVVEKLPGADPVAVTEGVEDALETLRPGLAGMQTDTSLFRPADYVGQLRDNLALALGLAGALVLIGLLALRMNWRGVLVSVVVVPLSLAAAALTLDLLGQGFNALTFAGLAAALAVVVDDAVVGSERVARRDRGVGASASRTSVPDAVLAATREVRTPLAFATAILLLAIVPLAVLGGRPGAFFRPLVLAYVLAVLASLLVALTVTPALSTLAFGGRRGADSGTEASKAASQPGQARTAYRRTIERAGTGRRALLAAGACGLLALLVLPFLDTSLVPTFQDRNVLVRLDGAAGTSAPRMTELTTEVASQIEAVPGVASVGAHVGRAVTGDRISNVSSSDVWVRIADDADYSATMDALSAVVDGVDGVVTSDVVTYSAAKLRGVGALFEGENAVDGAGLALLTGTDRPLAVRLYGQNQEILATEAKRVEQVVAGVDGVASTEIDTPPTQPSVEIEVDLARAQAFGITPGAVRRAEATLLQGIQVGSVFEDQKVYEVIVQGTTSTRTSVEAVENLLIDRPGGGQVRLADVADVRVADTPAVIQREAVSRRLDIAVGVDGRSVSDVAGDIETALAGMSLPLEYHAEVMQESTSEEFGGARVVGFALAAAAAMFLLLQAAFRSWRAAALVAALLPASLAGGLLVALVDGAEIGLGTLVGLLVVLGFAVRADVLLVSRIMALRTDPDGQGEAGPVSRATDERLAPVVLSAVALALSSLVLVVLGARPGLEILHPMALVVLGGLVTSVLVTLVLLPALARTFLDSTEQPTTTEHPRSSSPNGAEPPHPTNGYPRQRQAPVTQPGQVVR